MKMPLEPESPNYRQKCLNLKRKFKILLYENESFQDELKKSQRKLLKVTRDKSFLLDRLLKYENVESSSTDSDATVSSDSEVEYKPELPTIKKKKVPVSTPEIQDPSVASSSTTNTASEAKKKKSRKTCPVKPAVPHCSTSAPPTIIPPTPAPQQQQPPVVIATLPPEPPKPTTPNVKVEPIALNLGDGHMTSEEIERHLEAKQHLRDLIPEKTPLTVPVELFSNDPSVMECEIIDGHVDMSSNVVVENVGIVIDINE